MKHFICALLALGLGVGCGGKNPGGSVGKPRKLELNADSNVMQGNLNGVLHFGNGTEVSDLDPQVVTGVPEHHIILALFEGLAGSDPKSLKPIPAAAESWDMSEDGKVYTFHLRKDAVWSNGDPVTAHDFYFSYERMLNPKLGSKYSYMHYIVVNAQAYNEGKLEDFSQVGYKVLDDYTLEVTLNNPTAYFLQLLSHYTWYPVHPPTIKKYGAETRQDTKWTRPGNMVCNGAYVLDTWELNQKIIVKKRENYWDADIVRINEIRFYPTEDMNVEERDFRAGKIHVSNVIPPHKIKTYREKYPDCLMLDDYLGTYYYRFNVTRKPLDDVRVRKALCMAIDRKLITEGITKAKEVPALSFVPTLIEEYEPGAQHKEDVAEAQRLLAEAGFPNGEGFPKLELLYNTLETHRQIAQAIQQMWNKNLGIDIGLYNAEWKVYLDKQKTLDYDISRAGWIADYLDPVSFINMWIKDGGQNQTGWSSEEYDKLLTQAEATLDVAGRYKVFQQMEKMLVDEAPFMPIYFYTKAYLKHPSLKGWHPNLLNTHPYKFMYLENEEAPAAAASSPDEEELSGTPVEIGNKTQVLHRGNGTEIQGLDSATVTGVPEHRILMALFEGLVVGSPEDLSPMPGVAESWEVSDDGMEYTFKLRDDAKWSNGAPVTSDDFLFSYQRSLSPALGNEYAYMFYVVKNAEAFNKGELEDFSQVGFSAPDPQTFKIKLIGSTPYFLHMLNHHSWFPVHKETILKYGKMDERGTAWTRPGNLVGNGPFVLDTWKLNQVIIVKKSDTYWDKDNVRLNAVHYYPIDDENTEERSFRAGRLHVTSTMPLSKIDTYKKKYPEKLRMDTNLATYFYRFNTKRKPLDDKRVRHALAMSIDRQLLVERVTKGGQRPAFNLTPPDTSGYTSLAATRYDVEAARKLLAEAGYPNGEGFPDVEILYNTSEGHHKIAQVMQQMWREALNIQVGLINQEWKVYLATEQSLDYDISRAGWNGDYLDPNTFLDMFTSHSGNNRTGWSSEAYDALIAEAAVTKDLEARNEVFQKAEAILMDEMPIMPIYFYTRVYALQPSVKNWHKNLLDVHPPKHVYLEE